MAEQEQKQEQLFEPVGAVRAEIARGGLSQAAAADQIGISGAAPEPVAQGQVPGGRRGRRRQGERLAGLPRRPPRAAPGHARAAALGGDPAGQEGAGRAGPRPPGGRHGGSCTARPASARRSRCCATRACARTSGR